MKTKRKETKRNEKKQREKGYARSRTQDIRRTGLKLIVNLYRTRRENPALIFWHSLNVCTDVQDVVITIAKGINHKIERNDTEIVYNPSALPDIVHFWYSYFEKGCWKKVQKCTRQSREVLWVF